VTSAGSRRARPATSQQHALMLGVDDEVRRERPAR